jgi:CrcB protein
LEVTRFLLVCLGGAVGSGARFVVALGAARVLPAGFPFGTLLVNLVGCFGMGALMQLALSAVPLSPMVQSTLVAGFLGGFTTYSSFNQELTHLFLGGSWGRGFVYLLVTLVGCLGLGALGASAARAILPPG